MEMPLEFNSRAAWSSNCTRRDFSAVSMRRAEAAFLFPRLIWSVFYRAALRPCFRIPHVMSGQQIIQRRFHIFMSLGVIGEHLIVHGSFVGERAVAVDDKKTRRRLGAIAARDAAVQVEQKCSDGRMGLRNAFTSA